MLRWCLFMAVIIWSSYLHAGEIKVLSSQISRKGAESVKVDVHLASRISLQDLKSIATQIYEEVGKPQEIWIGFYVPDSKSVWGLSLRNFGRVEANEKDKLITRIEGFSLDEWKSFGESRLMYPPDAKVLGVWDFPFASQSGAEIAIYTWKGNSYVYTRYKSDGSGVPKRVTEKRHTDGRRLLEAYDSDYDFWLLKKDGVLERHEGGRLVTGWHGPKMTAATPGKKLGKFCEVVSAVRTEDVKLDDYKMPQRASIIRIAAVTDITDKTDAFSVAQDIVNQVSTYNAVDIEIGFYHNREPKAWTDRSIDLFITYTPDPSQLAYRDSVWSVAGVEINSGEISKTPPRSLCKVGPLRGEGAR